MPFALFSKDGRAKDQDLGKEADGLFSYQLVSTPVISSNSAVVNANQFELHWSTVLHWSTKFSTAPQTFIGMIKVISPDSKVLSTNQLLCHTLLMTTNQPGYNYQGWSLDRLFHAWLRLGIVWLLLKYLKGKLFQKWPRSEKCTSHNTTNTLDPCMCFLIWESSDV